VKNKNPKQFVYPFFVLCHLSPFIPRLAQDERRKMARLF
jgi:hypothetical protein